MSAPNGGSQSIAPYDIDNGATSTMEPPEVQAWDVQDSGQVDADVWGGMWVRLTTGFAMVKPGRGVC